jgi:hypothetical protein
MGLAACAHRPPKLEDMAFPFGTYHHQVTVTPKKNPEIKPIEVSGVVKSEPYDLRVVGLSPVGSTVFRIHEDLCAGTVTKEFYIEDLRKNEKHFESLHKLIKAVMFARKDKPDFNYYGAHVKLSKPDEKWIPRRIDVDHPSIRLNIEVTGYEVGK